MNPVALALLLAAPVATQDLIFEPGNPQAYQTLQSALDAAQPGQRILMRGSVSSLGGGRATIVRKSVTIEGQSPAAEFHLEYVSGLVVEACTPNIPLVLRNLEFLTHYSATIAYPQPALNVHWIPGGKIVLDNVVMEPDATSQAFAADWTRRVAQISIEHLSMRRCRLIAPDTVNSNGCCYPRSADGIGCLWFNGQSLAAR